MRVNDNQTNKQLLHKHPIVLCWNMHQPDYRDENGVYQQSWTYLHAIKDYTDMAAHLENVDGVRVVVNFSPILLDQLTDYLNNINTYLTGSNAQADPLMVLRDPLLVTLVAKTLTPTIEYKTEIIENCLKVHPIHCIERYSGYSDLANFARYLLKCPDRIPYVNDSFIFDLLMWYHLVWMGEYIKQSDFRFSRFVNQGGEFSASQRREMLVMIRDHMATIIPRYQDLAIKEKIELSMTPFAHPIAPLLLNLNNVKQVCPDIAMPVNSHYTDGPARLQWHIDAGLNLFQNYFDERPKGCLPAEGAIDEETLYALDRNQFSWTASGGRVLRQSLAVSQEAANQISQDCVHHLYQFHGLKIASFFRDDELSDLIGFTYSCWHADEAVDDLIRRLEITAKHFSDDEQAFTVIALDGEKAWQYYPNNGIYFLKNLYKRLSQHSMLRTVTFSDLVEQIPPVKRNSLTKVVAGSWVHGNLRMWIGDEDKNKAWDMLIEAKKCVDSEVGKGKYDSKRLFKINHQLAMCEGSDWFWWLGDDNPMHAVKRFDQLFRSNLSLLYQLIGLRVPRYLSEPFTHDHVSAELPLGGVMRKAE